MPTVAELQGFTFEGRWVIPTAAEGENCKTCGELHPYWTQNHVPIFIPDKWIAEGFMADRAVQATDQMVHEFGFVGMGTTTEIIDEEHRHPAGTTYE